MDGQRQQDKSFEPSLPAAKSTNTAQSSLPAAKRLSLAIASSTELPPSSPASASYDRLMLDIAPSPPAKLRRSPSSNSLSTSRSGTPTLTKRTSLSSLKGGGGGTSTPPRSPALRRQNSQLALSSPSGLGGRPLEPATEEPPPPPPVTEASVARDSFLRELESHGGTEAQSDLLVVIHDACYGHRYSRPKTTKASLSTIVERPERILAIVLGVSAAYVRLGGRHVGARHMPRPGYVPESIPFKIRKSNRYVPLVSAPVTSVHGTKWMNELKMMCEGAEGKLAMGGKELDRPSQFADEGDTDRAPFHEGDLYLCSESLNALEGALGGVFDAIDAVFDPTGPKRAFVAIRPPGHHCSDSYPSGFCWINNVHVGISHAAAVHGLTHAAIIDFDLHHGDGSQSITWDHNARVASLPKNAALSKRTAIGYFSLHDINSYPCEWGDPEKIRSASLCMENAHGQTIWNVHLQPWKTDAEFWSLYETRYLILLDKTRAFLRGHCDRLTAAANAPQPRAAIFISAGFDASEWEGQGMQRHKVNVPTDFYERFTRDINTLADEDGLGVAGRVISVLEGGYSDRALTSGVWSHISGLVKQKQQDETASMPDGKGLAQEMVQRLGNMSLEEDKMDHANVPVDRNWWSPEKLEELENLVNPPPPPPPRKPKGPVNPTYTTPTQSYVAKVVPVVRKTISGSLAAAAQRVIVPEIPPPDVGWVTSTHELSKVLTPDRQTRSCKPEDLNAKATEARRNRQSAIGTQSTTAVPAAEDGKRMQLRGRKAKAPTESSSRPSSRSSRRTTIGGMNALSEDSEVNRPKAPRRRVSVASTILSTTEEAAQTTTDHPAVSKRRESSSSVIRPVSSHSTRAPIYEEDSKTKPRSLSKSRAPKKVAATARPPVPRIPSTSSRIPKADLENKTKDLDALTTGLKKMSIKLNLPPKAEQEAREAKMKPSRAPKKAQTLAKSTKKAEQAAPQSTNATKSATSTEAIKVLPKPYTAPSAISLDLPLSTQAAPKPEPAIPTGLTSSQILTPNSNDNIPADLPKENNDGKIQVEKENAPEIANQMPPSFLPPCENSIPAPTSDATFTQLDSSSGHLYTNSQPDFTDIGSRTKVPSNPRPSSTPKRTHHDLPVFTSKSPIVFGPPNTSAASMHQELATNANINKPSLLDMGKPQKQASKDGAKGDDTEVDLSGISN